MKVGEKIRKNELCLKACAGAFNIGKDSVYRNSKDHNYSTKMKNKLEIFESYLTKIERIMNEINVPITCPGPA